MMTVQASDDWFILFWSFYMIKCYLVLLVGLILFSLPNTLTVLQVGKVFDDKYQADTDLVAAVLSIAEGLLKLRTTNLVNCSAKKLSKAIEGKSQLM